MYKNWLNSFKSKSKDESKELSSFVEARSLYGFAFHIYDKRNQISLCGYSQPIVTKTIVTREKIRKSTSHQHKGWYWCSECFYQFTGEKNNFSA